MIFQEFHFQVVTAVVKINIVKRLPFLQIVNVLYTKPANCCKIQAVNYGFPKAESVPDPIDCGAKKQDGCQRSDQARRLYNSDKRNYLPELTCAIINNVPCTFLVSTHGGHMPKVTDQEAREYHHLNGKPGKIAVVPTKPMDTQRDLSLAYTPGVAVPVLDIEKDPEKAYEYTSKGNLVAVLTNGTAILGLGDRGALASKPVMEGKGVLFKRFADVDVFDIEVNSHDPDEVIMVAKAIAPTFGGINLEDIKAPECFYIEETLKSMLDIPVFHDDQHGTAIISSAALANALEVVGKKHADIKMVISGAGASAISCANLAMRWGVQRQNIMMLDSKGVIYKGRTEGMNKYKEPFAVDTDKRTLAEAVRGADVFYGLSVANVLTPEMVRTMADRPFICAMANPDPEIKYELAKESRPDVIVATGRSDYPNQVNNVLGFPFIFRGALDVRASSINEEMKFAASKSLYNLTREDVPDYVLRAYGVDSLKFGPDYIIPKPLDMRVMLWESTAVAKAAMETGVARKKIDIDEYREQLAFRQGKGRACALLHHAQGPVRQAEEADCLWGRGRDQDHPGGCPGAG